MKKLRPRRGGKRGRPIRVENGRYVSHEELLNALVRRTAIVQASAGMPITSEEDRAKWRRQAASRTKKRREAGLCVQCQFPSSSRLCFVCHGKERDRQNKLRSARREAGLCVYCGQKAVRGSGRCSYHRALQAAADARLAKRAKGK